MNDAMKFPIGELTFDVEPADAECPGFIETIAAAPQNLREAISGLSDQQLDTPYREGGWTVRQVVHHLADSHMQAYCRTKLALTEKAPTIKPYDEAAWAELPDSKAPVGISLSLLDSVHERWVRILRSIPVGDFRKTGFVHPEMGRLVRLDQMLALYAWHSKHHTAHVTKLRERMGW